MNLWGDIMLAVKSMDVRENFKEWCNKVIGGETLVVSRPRNENVVIVSEKEYNEMANAKRNAEYLAMLDRSYKQLENGETISFSIEELRAMQGIGKPESLKHRPGYSRRIDEKNRLVYDIDELQNIKIISCRGHYDD